MKPSLPWDKQVSLLRRRGLEIGDDTVCEKFLAATNYYRFSGYFRSHRTTAMIPSVLVSLSMRFVPSTMLMSLCALRLRGHWHKSSSYSDRT